MDRGGTISAFSAGEDGYFGYVHFLFLFARMTQMRNYADAGYDLLCKAQDSLGTVMHDMTFRSGICGCCWLIEYLSQEGLIEENPEDLLETVDAYIRQNIGETMPVEDLAGIGRYYLAKMQNRPTRNIAMTVRGWLLYCKAKWGRRLLLLRWMPSC